MRVRVNDVELYFDAEGSGLVVDGPVMRERPTLLLLHGGPGFDHSTFKPEYGQLADVAQVVYLDHRGNGRSDRGDPARWNLETWADDVRAFCEAVGIERPVVLGWSFGGMVAMAYATRHPEHPAKLILQSTMARLDVDLIAEGFRRIGGDEAAEVARTFWTSGGGDAMAGYAVTCMPLYDVVPMDFDALPRTQLNPDLLADPARVMRDVALAPGLSRVACPTLVIAGEDDPVCPIEAAEEIVAALPRDLVQFERFPKARHFVHHAEPDRFFSVIRGFLAG